jgi:hypothetical protein
LYSRGTRRASRGITVEELADNIPVGIAEEVGEHVDVDVDAGGAKVGHDGQDVVGGPACNKCTYGVRILNR